MFFEMLTGLGHGTKRDKLSPSSSKELLQSNLSGYKRRFFFEYRNLCWSLNLCSVSVSFTMCVGPDRLHIIITFIPAATRFSFNFGEILLKIEAP